jgi:hypothetical protein
VSSNFPTSKDNLTNPASTDALVGHAEQHANANDAIEALENVVGVTNSTDSDSLTYKVNQMSTAISTLSNTSTAIETLMGLEGNNDLTIAGIQNKTTIDSYSASDYRTATYALQITKTSTGESYFSNLTALRGPSDIYVSESNIVTNANSSIATTAFESANGIISLTVTPVTGEVTVRYFRTALK